MPLLFEASSQAQFLKPTVITLVYGLGFGVILVLIVVPALMAMQQDAGAQVNAFKRGLRGMMRGRGPAAPLAVAGSSISMLFVLTLGWQVVAGDMHPMVPSLTAINNPTSIHMALAMFTLGAAGITVITYVISAIAVGARRQR
ncbi:MAG: AcrB/AcrD/AcrF family protein, partial [Planktomarina sp.]